MNTYLLSLRLPRSTSESSLVTSVSTGLEAFKLDLGVWGIPY